MRLPLATAVAAVLLATGPAHAAPLGSVCVRHEEWPVRKYDCVGAGIVWNDHVCAAHWTDDDSDASWTDDLSRVITTACAGDNGVVTCNEHDFAASWDCTGVGTEGPDTFCAAYSWFDDDPDPYVDAGATWTSRLGCV
jgi:hypothetical protein